MKAERLHYEATWGPGFDYVDIEEAKKLERKIVELEQEIKTWNKDRALLYALQDYGVDNWQYYGRVLEELNNG